MNASFSQSNYSKRIKSIKSGFTLIELLSVVTVVALLLGVSASSLTSSLQAQQLTANANRVAGELSSLALQAIRENREIQIRVVRQKSEVGEDLRLRALQAYSIEPQSGLASPMGELILLDSRVIIMDNESRSTILTHHQTGAPEGYVTFHPTGRTDLPLDAEDKWSLTLILERDTLSAETESSLPANYRTLVINAHTSAVRVY